MTAWSYARCLSSHANAVFANVLQSPNHGHRKLTDSFLAKSAADRIILSQGKTHDERILYRRKKTYSTEQHGQVTVSMARQGISVKTFR
jgi:beta-lactamase superfamily II metal-dependent hydrolase